MINKQLIEEYDIIVVEEDIHTYKKVYWNLGQCSLIHYTIRSIVMLDN